MVAQDVLRSKLLQNHTLVSYISCEISFITTTTMGAGAAHIPEGTPGIISFTHSHYGKSRWESCRLHRVPDQSIQQMNMPRRVCERFLQKYQHSHSRASPEGGPINKLCIQAAVFILRVLWVALSSNVHILAHTTVLRIYIQFGTRMLLPEKEIK